MVDPTPGSGTPGAPSPLELALTTLIGVSTWLKPDDLAEAVADAAHHLGGRDVELLLVDISQRSLQRLCPRGTPAPQGRPVDGPGAGEAYRTERMVSEPTASGTRLWVPILDSAERVGVLGTTVDIVDAGTERRWSLVGSLIGELVVTKSRYGDAISNTRRTGEVSIAAELRWALLPPLTYTSDEVVVSGILEPAHDVAGDSFDYAVNGDDVRVAVFDAMGHGLNASRLANLAVGTHRNNRRRHLDVVADVRQMDDVIRRQIGDSQFVTALVASLELSTGVIRSVAAGHPAAVVFHADGTHSELPTARCRPLGLGADPPEAVAAQLRPGDVVVIYTDGIDEARSPAGEYFGTDRLFVLVRELLDRGVRPAEIGRRVIHDLLAHQRNLVDDASLVVLGWRTPEPVPPAGRGLLPG